MKINDLRKLFNEFTEVQRKEAHALLDEVISMQEYWQCQAVRAGNDNCAMAKMRDAAEAKARELKEYLDAACQDRHISIPALKRQITRERTLDKEMKTWLADRPGPGMCECTRTRLHADRVNVVYNILGNQVFPEPLCTPRFVYFYDLMPGANWAHPCAYAHIGPSGEEPVLTDACWPPDNGELFGQSYEPYSTITVRLKDII
jgi:hypothetical protein